MGQSVRVGQVFGMLVNTQLLHDPFVSGVWGPEIERLMRQINVSDARSSHSIEGDMNNKHVDKGKNK